MTGWTTPETIITGNVLPETYLDKLRDNLTFLKSNIALEAAVELTIASGAVIKSRAHHTIDTEADAASDDLATISGGAEGEILLIRPASGARTVVLKHNTGNIWSPMFMDLSLVDADSYALLAYSGSKWCIIGAGGGSFTNLNDVPNSYAGSGGKLVVVKATADGLEFVNAGVSPFTNLSDVPASYAGSGGKLVAVKAGVNGLEFVTAPSGDFKADGSIPMTNNLNFAAHEADGMCIEGLTADPLMTLGRIYRNTTSHKLFYCKEDA